MPPVPSRAGLPGSNMAHRPLNSICVLCGSNAGRDPAYVNAATGLGKMLARRRIKVVYGGAEVGLMGALADAALAAGGEVACVITPDLDARVGHSRLHLERVASMHERKRRFSDRADAFIALPGGFGTLDELFEALTWNQLGIHDKPTGLLNVAGYFDALLAFLRHTERERFVREEHCAMLVVEDDPGRLIEALAAQPSMRVDKRLAP